MKKLLVLLMTALIVCVCSVSVAASTSPSGGSSTVIVPTGLDKIIEVGLDSASTDVTNSKSSFQPDVSGILPAGAEVSTFFDYWIIGSPDDHTTSVKLTFYLGDQLAGATEAGIVHLNADGTGARKVAGTFANGYLTVNTTLSPIAIYVVRGTNASVKIPTTGIE